MAILCQRQDGSSHNLKSDLPVTGAMDTFDGDEKRGLLLLE
jgi:hypothetical protein